uniref:Set2 Rpb1 interacting domain-containing protein n=1 Tax=Timema poppense TaxID=170557 RepID=A0A7R9CYJ0_TIMPO|nr:unnamed protein product [Timema poppensis]
MARTGDLSLEPTALIPLSHASNQGGGVVGVAALDEQGLRSRENYLTSLIDTLWNNYERCHLVDCPELLLSKDDVEQCAVFLEYQDVFSKNKVSSLYRRDGGKLLSSIKKDTNVMNIFEALKNFTPQDTGLRAAVLEAQKCLEERRKQPMIIMTAAQLLSLDQEAGKPKHVEKQTELKVKKKPFSLKKDPLVQTNVTSFFQKMEEPPLEQNSRVTSDEESCLTTGDEARVLPDLVPLSKPQEEEETYQEETTNTTPRRRCTTEIPRQYATRISPQDSKTEEQTEKRKLSSLFGDDSSDDGNSFAGEKKRSSILGLPPVHSKPVKRSEVLPARPEGRTKVSAQDRKVVADRVVKYLMPFYKRDRIATRELFKMLARHLVHQMFDDRRETDEASVKQTVQMFFKKHRLVKSEADLNK